MWEFNELDENKVNQWCKGTVLAIKKGNNMHIQWEQDTLHEGHPKISQETLATSESIQLVNLTSKIRFSVIHIIIMRL